MMDAVHRYEGTVSHALGDGIMALFGAPIAHEDHAVRACYAALALQDGMRRYAEQARRTHGALVQARVGLNSGEVVVRLISDDLHMDYTAMGPTVHLASRVEQLAREGTCLLTAETLRLVEGYVQVRTIGAVAIKGLDRTGRAVRAAGRRCGADAPASYGGARPDPVCRTSGRAGRRSTAPSNVPSPATANWWPWWGSRASASRAWSGRSPTLTARRAGWCWRAAPSPTGRRHPGCR